MGFVVSKLLSAEVVYPWSRRRLPTSSPNLIASVGFGRSVAFTAAGVNHLSLHLVRCYCNNSWIPVHAHATCRRDKELKGHPGLTQCVITPYKAKAKMEDGKELSSHFTYCFRLFQVPSALKYWRFPSLECPHPWYKLQWTYLAMQGE